MQNHTKVWLQFFNIKDTSECFCIYCGGQATSLHHLLPRQMGGSKFYLKDYVENLAPLQ